MATTRDRWVSANEAAEILSAHTDHEVSADYVRMLSRIGKIRFRARDGRTNEYNLADVKAYEVRPLGKTRVRPRPSTKKHNAA